MKKIVDKKQNVEISENISNNCILGEVENNINSNFRLVNNDKLIKIEKKKLLKILSKIDENLIKICDSLLENVAFMSILLNDLMKTIKIQGIKESYKNGQNQFGYKESVESQSYNKYMKSYQSSVKILIDILTKDESTSGDEIEELKKWFTRPRNLKK